MPTSTMPSKTQVPRTPSREGCFYTATGGLKKGLETEGYIEDVSNLSISSTSDFDVIVIGAGYAGLTAARDLSIGGHKVLLLEARDRIGGRTWTSQVEGDKFEMGGTWIHWQQGFVWREMARYGIERDIKITPNEDYPAFARNKTMMDGKSYDQDYEENFKMMDATLAKLCDVDGKLGATVVALAPQVMDGPFVNSALVSKMDEMSCADRIKELEDAGKPLSGVELAYMVPWIELSFGAEIGNCSFLELIKWFQHGNQSFYFLGTTLWFYKLKDGQSHLARLIFEEAKQTKNLSYAFQAPVTAVNDHGDSSVTVKTSQGNFTARRVISTLPMNVAKNVKFEPALPALKQEAFEQGHVNKGLKVHSFFAEPGFRSGQWTNKDSINKTTFSAAFGDQILKDGKTSVVVAFGAANTEIPSQHPEQIRKWIGGFDHRLSDTYQGSVWHEWNEDEYARGTWNMFDKGMYTKFWSALQQRTGNVLWASADWADGWKSFIDGAIEQGTKAAFIVRQELLQTSTSGDAANAGV